MSDLIYRQAAINAMKELCENYTRTTSTKHPHINFIIEELEALPSAQPEYRMDEWCTDCKEYDHERHCCPRFNHVIRTTLQEAQERKKGKWIIVTDSRGRHAECPYCGEWKYHSNQKFCGECGAQMEGEDE